jgi:hypothetical protein
MRFAASVLPLALGACATTQQPAVPRAPTGEWKFGAFDRNTGRPVGSALLRVLSDPHPGQLIGDPVFLELQCFKSKPVIQLAYNRRTGANRSASVIYRFEGHPARQPKVRFVDTKNFVIEDDAAVRQFVDELRTANRLVVVVNSLIVGRTRAVFPVQFGELASETAFALCPVPSKAKRTS